MIISIPNRDYTTRRAKEVPEQQFENLNYFKSMDRMSGSTNERVEKSMSSSNLWKGSINLQEFTAENVSQHVHMERREYLDQDSEADRSIRELRTASVARDLAEYSVSAEHCSVFLENKGALHERTQRGWADEQRGRQLENSPKYAVVRSVSTSAISASENRTDDVHRSGEKSSNAVCQISSSMRTQSTSCVEKSSSTVKVGDDRRVVAPVSFTQFTQPSFPFTFTAPQENSQKISSAQAPTQLPVPIRQLEQVSLNEQQVSRSYCIPNLRAILPPHAATQSVFWDASQQNTALRSSSLPPKPPDQWTRQLPVRIVPATTTSDEGARTSQHPSINSNFLPVSLQMMIV
ncbi:hypothetical protein M3Y97_00612900 [Aphelenchoides bicaudatus]|nr:hypothetical protein M3Y97_00612900 [Aphelenchoides bicaudatus]